jgi:tetratricopeptide (TPR) repeat protein
VLLDLAVLYEEEKADDKTEATLKGVLQRDPANHRALNHLGYFYAERGRKLQEAVSLIRDALKAEPKNWAYLDSLGWACFKLGRYPEALEKLQEAIRIQDDPVLREHLGSVFEAAGNKEKAREHWLRALELDPKRETLRDRINKLNETAGQASP